ncbi:MAG: hypothetical protein LBG93_06085 [Treponema sp.]|nr:hypothetical protein [Treponema sp.]
MAKRIFLFVLAAFLASGVLFAQERMPSNVRDNWISFEGTLLVGVGLQYERMLNSRFSLVVNARANLLFPAVLDVGLAAMVRYYPWERSFFAGLGLGYQLLAVPCGGGFYGLGLTPEVGWKLDIGEEGGFFIQPGIRLPIVFAVRSPFRVVFFPSVYLGLGFAF